MSHDHYGSEVGGEYSLGSENASSQLSARIVHTFVAIWSGNVHSDYVEPPQHYKSIHVCKPDTIRENTCYSVILHILAKDLSSLTTIV